MNKFGNLARVCMAPGLQLGINQAAIDRYFKTASIRGYQRDLFDLGLELLQQLIDQADGPAGVVSDGTVDHRDV